LRLDIGSIHTLRRAAHDVGWLPTAIGGGKEILQPVDNVVARLVGAIFTSDDDDVELLDPITDALLHGIRPFGNRVGDAFTGTLAGAASAP
jgi:hypothetical protein